MYHLLLNQFYFYSICRGWICICGSGTNINKTRLCHVLTLAQVWVISWGKMFSLWIFNVIFSSMVRCVFSLGMLPFLYTRIRNNCFCLVLYSLQITFPSFVLCPKTTFCNWYHYPLMRKIRFKVLGHLLKINTNRKW